MKAFIVTRGEYSDFGIDSVWSTKERAEEYVRLRGDQGYGGVNKEIEEYELDGVGEIHEVVEVTMDANLAFREIRQFGVAESDEYDKKVGFVDFTHFERGGEDGTVIPAGCLIWRVATGDRESAVKVTAEKATLILAAGIWGDDDKVKEANV